MLFSLLQQSTLKINLIYSSFMKYDTDQIKQISIVNWLDKNGYKKQRGSGKYVSYLSMLGEESNPSFKVNTASNRWRDYHSDKWGNIIDLVMAIEKCDFMKACEILTGDKGVKIEPYAPQKQVSGVTVHLTQDITSKELIDYFCGTRKIAEEVLYKYCKELTISFPYGKAPEKTYKVIGFKNDMGGYECRSSWQKIATSPKCFTTVQGDDSSVMIWEGFADFMSYLTFNEILVPEYKTYVLNGLGMINVLKPFLKGKNILYYCDNDAPADNALAALDESNVTDMRYTYGFYNDYNSWLQNY